METRSDAQEETQGPEIPQGPVRRSLRPADIPSARLLLCVANHILPEHLVAIATELQVEEPEFKRIEADFPLNSLRQIMEVLISWEKRDVRTTQELIDRVKEWRKKRYVVKEVWSGIKDLIGFELPAHVETEPPARAEEANQKGSILPERLDKLRLLTKQSLRTKPFCLAVGKDWTLKSSKIDLRETYTDLSWTRKHRKAYTVEQEDLKNITQILNEEQLGEDGPVRILVKGKGGIGKSTAMKHLAISWADGTVEELNKFHFIFHIALKHVKDNSPIENIIIAQHSGLKANNVKPAEIKSILEGDTDSKVLLLIDGHDEYKTGRNTDIDDAIKKERLWNCWMILTSRETEDIKSIQEYMDAEAEIHGFDRENVEYYVKKSLGSNEMKNSLLQQAVNTGLCTKVSDVFVIATHSILTIPILLNMICVLFLCNKTLPSSKNGIIQAMVDRCIDREAIRTKGQKAIDSAKRALFNLGKLAWQGLNEPGKKLIFEKEEVIRVAGKEALELGLLFGTERMSMQEEETDVLCFSHLLLQEFAAAKYIAELEKDELELLFPTWESLRQHREVVRLACGITSQPDVLVELITDRLTTHIIYNGLDALSMHSLLFYSMMPEQEIPEGTNFDPFHNQYINYIEQSGEEREFITSKVYISKLGLDSTAMMYPAENSSIPNINDSAQPVKQVEARGTQEASCSLELLREVRKHQHRDVTRVNCSKFALCCSDTPNVLTLQIKEWMYRNELLGDFLKDIDKKFNQHESIAAEGDLQEVGSRTCAQFSNDKELTDLVALVGEIKWHPRVTVELPQLREAEVVPNPSGTLLQKIYQMLSEDAIPEDTELSENTLDISTYTLTGLMGKVLDHSRIQGVSHMNLATTGLQESDIRSLSLAAQHSFLFHLKTLNLSGNSLSGLVGHLVDYTGFTSLENLYLEDTQLKEEDIKSLSVAIQSGRLPKLTTLSLAANNLNTMEEAVESFIQACVEHVKDRELELLLSFYHKSDDLRQRINSLCEGSSVRPIWHYRNYLSSMIGRNIALSPRLIQH